MSPNYLLILNCLITLCIVHFNQKYIFANNKIINSLNLLLSFESQDIPEINKEIRNCNLHKWVSQ